MKNSIILFISLFICLQLMAQSELKPRLWVLSIGITEYKDTLLNLTFAHSDANQIAEGIEKRAISAQNYASCTVKKWINDQANKTNIQQTLADLRKSMSQTDVLIVYFAGQASHIEGQNYLYLHDYQAENLSQTSITLNELTENIPGKVMVLFEPGKGKISDNLSSNVSVLFSAASTEFAYEKPSWGHSAFAKAILEVIEGKSDVNMDGKVYVGEMNLYIAERVKALTKGKQNPQMENPLDIPVF